MNNVNQDRIAMRHVVKPGQKHAMAGVGIGIGIALVLGGYGLAVFKGHNS